MREVAEVVIALLPLSAVFLVYLTDYLSPDQSSKDINDDKTRLLVYAGHGFMGRSCLRCTSIFPDAFKAAFKVLGSVNGPVLTNE